MPIMYIFIRSCVLFVCDRPRCIAGRQHGLDDRARLIQCFLRGEIQCFAGRDSSDFACGLRHGGQFDAGGHIRSVVPGHGYVFRHAHAVAAQFVDDGQRVMVGPYAQCGRPFR